MKILQMMPVDNWDRYMDTLKEYPITVKAATSGSVYVIGDVISQVLEGKDMGKLDRSRVLRSGSLGFLLHGPLSHFWYRFSDYGFNQVLHMKEWWSVFPKVGVD